MKKISFSVKKKLRKSSSLVNFKEKKSLKKYSQDNNCERKSFYESLLLLIKNCQTYFLSSLSQQNNIKNVLQNGNRMPVKFTKNILTKLKRNLELIQTQKLDNLNNMKIELNNRKTDLHNIIKFSLKRKEINQLRDMNFLYENEIQKLESLINLRNKNLFLIKSYNCFLEMFEERFCKSIKSYEEIEMLYKEKSINAKNILIKTEIEIIETEKKIGKMREEINSIKNKIIEEENTILKINNIKEDTQEKNVFPIKKQYDEGPNKKKVNFKLFLDDKKEKEKVKEKLNNFSSNRCKYFNFINKNLLHKSKIKFEKNIRRNSNISCPDINSYKHLKKISSLCLKNTKINKNINFTLFHNKTISDNERTTISSFNDKTMNTENILNKTF